MRARRTARPIRARSAPGRWRPSRPERSARHVAPPRRGPCTTGAPSRGSSSPLRSRRAVAAARRARCSRSGSRITRTRRRPARCSSASAHRPSRRSSVTGEPVVVVVAVVVRACVGPHLAASARSGRGRRVGGAPRPRRTDRSSTKPGSTRRSAVRDRMSSNHHAIHRTAAPIGRPAAQLDDDHAEWRGVRRDNDAHPEATGDPREGRPVARGRSNATSAEGAPLWAVGARASIGEHGEGRRRSPCAAFACAAVMSRRSIVSHRGVFVATSRFATR